MNYMRLDSADSTLILYLEKNTPPRFVHWGAVLAEDVSPANVDKISRLPSGPGIADKHVYPSLALEPGLGLLGPTGFSAHRHGTDWSSLFTVQDVQLTGQIVKIICEDSRTKLSLQYDIELDAVSSVLTISSELKNNGRDGLDLAEMATACMPIPAQMTEIIGFSGRWSDEFRRENISRFSGSYLRENRKGRTSHDSFPAFILTTKNTNESNGEAYGFHLAWSGNHRLRVDTDFDGRTFASLGALLLPGEIRLDAGETYESPQIVASYSANGLSSLSQNFHCHVRSKILRPQTYTRPRPVHYNTWEAVYFDHDIDKLKGIAVKAAAIGVERFVLDDGWFGSRRSDESGLGDWYVSDEVYPNGLVELVDYVTSLGMEMGIWFEPEMVNPDSDLYREHPDWVLGVEGLEQVPFRNQYVLDISRPEISDYLFDRIDDILSKHTIGYIKWDMNRDLNHPGDVNGRPRAHAQVAALYDLIDRVREAHPTVEIESCSSGGARPDMGILKHTDRIWTSDTNDAIDRQTIQRGASFFLPLNVIGSHVGPRDCHVTGRSISMAMRAATALMGHMGLELNLVSEPQNELDELKNAISLYKEHRSLLHSGDLYRLETSEYLSSVGVVSPDKSEALFSAAFVSGHPATIPEKLHFSGLDDQAKYRLRIIWPAKWHNKSSRDSTYDSDLEGEGIVCSGSELMSVGLQLPNTGPETAFLFQLTNQANL